MIEDPFKDYLGYALRRASAVSMAQLAEVLAEFKLRPTEATVLVVVDDHPGATQSEIGRLLAIATANMAPLISRLEERDLIEREPVDGRSHGLNLSSRGRNLASRVKKAVAAYEAGLLAKVPVADRQRFLAVLQNIWQNDVGSNSSSQGARADNERAQSRPARKAR